MRTIPVVLGLAAAGLAQAAAQQAPSGWKTQFVQNARLPPVFAQGAAPRPDGSTLTFFLGNFNNSIATRKPLLVYLDGSALPIADSPA
jgi:hypothetical protein